MNLFIEEHKTTTSSPNRSEPKPPVPENEDRSSSCADTFASDKHHPKHQYEHVLADCCEDCTLKDDEVRIKH